MSKIYHIDNRDDQPETEHLYRHRLMPSSGTPFKFLRKILRKGPTRVSYLQRLFGSYVFESAQCLDIKQTPTDGDYLWELIENEPRQPMRILPISRR